MAVFALRASMGAAEIAATKTYYLLHFQSKSAEKLKEKEILSKLSLYNNSTVVHFSNLELTAIRNHMSQKFSTISMDTQALGHFTSKFRYKRQLYV